jgi:hypothetical protein
LFFNEFVVCSVFTAQTTPVKGEAGEKLCVWEAGNVLGILCWLEVGRIQATSLRNKTWLVDLEVEWMTRFESFYSFAFVPTSGSELRMAPLLIAHSF